MSTDQTAFDAARHEQRHAPSSVAQVRRQAYGLHQDGRDPIVPDEPGWPARGRQDQPPDSVEVLRWKCIDWETGRVTVTERVFEGKSSKPETKAGERGVVLNEAQLAELREYKQKHYPDAEPEGWLFPGKRNGPIDAGWFMTKTIKPIAQSLGFPAIHWHALRHWNNSAMLTSGIDPAVRMKRVGHSSVKTNMIYSHADLALQKAASNAIWQRLQAAKPELESKKGESKDQLSPFSVTPNQPLSLTP